MAKGLTLEELQKMGAKPVTPSTGGLTLEQLQAQEAQPKKGLYDTVSTALGSFSKGVAKGELSTLKGLGTVGESILSNTVGRATNLIQGKGFTKPEALPGQEIYRKGTPEEQKASQALTPQGTAEKVGFGTEKFAEFLAPSGVASKGEKIVDILALGIKKPLLASATKIAGKATVQGISAGGVSLAQTGDLKTALDTAKTAGIIRGGFATIGEGARAIRLPERLYSTIFKNSADDMAQELKTEALAGLKESNPDKFNSFVKAGIIKTDANGSITVNPTVAKQALDAGLRGNIRGMTKTVITGALDSEAEVQQAVKSYKGTVSLKEPQFKNVLRDIQGRYQDVGFNEISDEAGKLAKVIENSNGNVDAGTALAIRRLLDRARIASSYEAPVQKLSLTQANLKTLADTLRGRVNEIPGVGEVMKRYSFYIDAMDTLAKEAARRGNNQALSLIDSLFLSGGLGGGTPIPSLTAGMFRKLLMSGPGITGAGQVLNRSVASPATSGAINTASNLLNPQKDRQEKMRGSQLFQESSVNDTGISPEVQRILNLQ